MVLETIDSPQIGISDLSSNVEKSPKKPFDPDNFLLEESWNYYKDSLKGYLVAKNETSVEVFTDTVPGLKLAFPHHSENMQEIEDGKEMVFKELAKQKRKHEEREDRSSFGRDYLGALFAARVIYPEDFEPLDEETLDNLLDDGIAGIKIDLALYRSVEVPGKTLFRRSYLFPQLPKIIKERVSPYLNFIEGDIKNDIENDRNWKLNFNTRQNILEKAFMAKLLFFPTRTREEIGLSDEFWSRVNTDFEEMLKDRDTTRSFYKVIPWFSFYLKVLNSDEARITENGVEFVNKEKVELITHESQPEERSF